jgi:hypothetical protein
VVQVQEYEVVEGRWSVSLKCKGLQGVLVFLCVVGAVLSGGAVHRSRVVHRSRSVYRSRVSIGAGLSTYVGLPKVSLPTVAMAMFWRVHSSTCWMLWSWYSLAMRDVAIAVAGPVTPEGDPRL